MLAAVRERLRSPRTILVAALLLFLIYSWPGFVGWDTRDHMLQAREGTFSNGHPPMVILLVRICDFFVRGPALVLLVQAVSLLTGLYLLFLKRLAPLAAAIAAAAVFLFPPIAGVTAVIAKDGLMAGFLVLGIAFLLDPKRSRIALGFVLLASLMRWNSLPATFAPVVLLYRWGTLTGFKRYAVAFGVWMTITFVSYEVNAVMSDRDEYLWYWSSAYEDIAGTIQYSQIDDAQLDEILAGTPLRFHDHLNDRFRAIYDPTNFYQLMRDGDRRIWDMPDTEAQRDAVYAAWKQLVFDHRRAYLTYRWDNYRYLNQIEHPEAFSNVYVWFTVIAAPTTIAELEHDAAASRVQGGLIRAAMWVSLTPIYWVFWYFALCFVLLPLCVRRRPLELALLLSAIGYQLSWFFLAQSTDYRYSSWMELCAVIVSVLLFASFRLARRSRAAHRTDSAAVVRTA
jgi:hypothetical protein